jgi:ArsR family transcriptional regulator, arsenate/arsenite/antimonite-responsive transcriptional repressor
LTEVRHFDIFGNVKALPLSRLHARDAHVEAFKALAHQSRLQIFFFLVKAKAEVAAGDIQAQLEIPGPTLSHHLDILRRAGLVQSRREERYIYYSPRAEMVSELVRILTACC